MNYAAVNVKLIVYMIEFEFDILVKYKLYAFIDLIISGGCMDSIQRQDAAFLADRVGAASTPGRELGFSTILELLRCPLKQKAFRNCSKVHTDIYIRCTMLYYYDIIFDDGSKVIHIDIYLLCYAILL